MEGLTIAKDQATLHKITEFFAVLFSLYVIFVVAPALQDPHQQIMQLFGIGTIIVDGYLFTTWK